MNECINCGPSIIRYLDCEDCKQMNKECIYVCTQCGQEVIYIGD